MIPIESTNRVDWNAIRAEYIGGGVSYRQIAKKYSIPFGTVRCRAQKEHWVKEREHAEHSVNTMTAQKTAEAVSSLALEAVDFKRRLLRRLQRIEEKYPLDATEVRTRQGNSTAIFRIRDLTAAYKDLAEGITSAGTEKNAPVYELLRKIDQECSKG